MGTWGRSPAAASGDRALVSVLGQTSDKAESFLAAGRTTE